MTRLSFKNQFRNYLYVKNLYKDKENGKIYSNLFAHLLLLFNTQISTIYPSSDLKITKHKMFNLCIYYFVDIILYLFYLYSFQLTFKTMTPDSSVTSYGYYVIFNNAQKIRQGQGSW